MLVIFSGGSGVGKNTIIEHLLKHDEFALLPTYTTRECRPNESNGNPYYFITESEFKNRMLAGEFYEHEVVHGYHYGTSKLLLQDRQKLGKVLLKDIDVLGTQNLVNNIGKDISILTIFLRVDSKEVLIERLRQRKEKEIAKRLERYDMEQTFQNDYDYIVTNNDFSLTLSNSLDIIRYENNGKFLKSSQSIRDMNEEKVWNLAKLLNEDISLPPIDVAIKDHELYVVDGHHRYLASIFSGKKIAKRVITPNYIDDVEQYSWQDSLEYFAKERNNGNL